MDPLTDCPICFESYEPERGGWGEGAGPPQETLQIEPTHRARIDPPPVRGGTRAPGTWDLFPGGSR